MISERKKELVILKPTCQIPSFFWKKRELDKAKCLVEKTCLGLELGLEAMALMAHSLNHTLNQTVLMVSRQQKAMILKYRSILQRYCEVEGTIGEGLQCGGIYVEILIRF